MRPVYEPGALHRLALHAVNLTQPVQHCLQIDPRCVQQSNKPRCIQLFHAMCLQQIAAKIEVDEGQYLHVYASCKDSVAVCGGSKGEDIRLMLAEGLKEGTMLAVPQLDCA